jgi:hypothetical protein
VTVVGLSRPEKGHGRPRFAAAPDRRDRQVIWTAGALDTDEAGQQFEVPGTRSRDGEEQLRARIAISRDRDAASIGAKNLARLAQHVAHRMLGILDVLQVAR